MRDALPLFLILLCGCASHIPAAIRHLDPSHSQAILVESLQRPVYKARLSLWEKEGLRWSKVYQYPAVLGRNGVAKAGEKKEGDGHTPYGVYDLKKAFGYSPGIPTGLSYSQVLDDDFWVDDSQSAQYNQWVKGTPNASSWEILRRKDYLYRYAAVIEYNTSPIVKGAGSAIFMHVWRNDHHPTAGCVALNERNIKKLLKRLNISDHPVIIINGE